MEPAGAEAPPEAPPAVVQDEAASAAAVRAVLRVELAELSSAERLSGMFGCRVAWVVEVSAGEVWLSRDGPGCGEMTLLVSLSLAQGCLSEILKKNERTKK